MQLVRAREPRGDAYVHERITALNADRVCRAPRIPGYFGELHPNAVEGGSLAGRKRERFTERNGRPDGTLVTGRPHDKTQQNQNDAHLGWKSRGRTTTDQPACRRIPTQRPAS